MKLNLETYDTSFNSTLGSRIVLKINNIPQNLFAFVCPTSRQIILWLEDVRGTNNSIRVSLAVLLVSHLLRTLLNAHLKYAPEPFLCAEKIHL